MHPNEQRLYELFDCLNHRNVDGIMACYHPEQAKFEDIAFRLKNRDQIRAMWDLIWAMFPHLTDGQVRA